MQVGQFCELIELVKQNPTLEKQLLLLFKKADWKKATQHAAIAVSPDFRPRIWWCPDGDSSSSSGGSGRIGLLFGCENAVVQVGGVCTLLSSVMFAVKCDWQSWCTTDMAVALRRLEDFWPQIWWCSDGDSSSGSRIGLLFVIVLCGCENAGLHVCGMCTLQPVCTLWAGIVTSWVLANMMERCSFFLPPLGARGRWR
jgi:hypothetical protein